jgi:hypothetical protein
MIIPITEQAGHVSALGHRVPTDPGGVPELKRRCLETLSRLKDPPDRVWFRLPTDMADTPEAPPATPAPGLARAVPRAPEAPAEPARQSASQGQRQGRSRR